MIDFQPPLPNDHGAVKEALHVINRGLHQGMETTIPALRTDALVTLSLSDDAGIAAQAASILGTRNDPSVLPALTAKIDQDPNSSYYHVLALSELALNDRESIETLGRVISREGVLYEVRDAAVQALVKIGSPQAVVSLRQCLASADLDTLNSIGATLAREREHRDSFRSIAPIMHEAYARLSAAHPREALNSARFGLLMMDWNAESGTWSNAEGERPTIFAAGIAGRRDLIPHPECFITGRMNTDLPWDPQSGDIVVKMEPVAPGSNLVRVATNVAWTVHDGGNEFNWGYVGSGPGELAINILNQVFPPGKDGHRAIRGVLRPPYWATDMEMECSATALALALDFEKAFVAKIPQAGGTISGKKIRSWVKERGKIVADYAGNHDEMLHGQLHHLKRFRAFD